MAPTLPRVPGRSAPGLRDSFLRPGFFGRLRRGLWFASLTPVRARAGGWWLAARRGDRLRDIFQGGLLGCADGFGES